MASSDTLYVYDWPMLFESAAEKQWENFGKENGKKDTKSPMQDVFACQELVIHDPKTGAIHTLISVISLSFLPLHDMVDHCPPLVPSLDVTFSDLL